MADDSLFPGGIAPTDKTHPLPGAHDPQLGGHEAPPGMDPGHDPLSDTDRDDDWVDSTADEDIPPADEPTPLSDDLR